LTPSVNKTIAFYAIVLFTFSKQKPILTVLRFGTVV
jgi:hypothetical protein